jgi:hypothetical protein
VANLLGPDQRAYQSLWVAGYIVRKEFQSNEATEPNIFGFVDNAHSPATEFLQDTVVGNGLTDQGLRVTHVAAMVGVSRKQVNDLNKLKSTVEHGQS